MHVVRLLSFPHPRHERIERVIQKHSGTLQPVTGRNGGQLDHAARKALLHEVAAGRPQVVARYVESHAADNAANELKLLDAKVEVLDEGAPS